jgi:tRNA(Ile)-lysidine synthase
MLTHAAQGDETAGRDRARSAAGLPAAPAQAGERIFSDETIARLFRSWDELAGVLLAVSGGPDSVALMLLAARWAKGRPAAPRLSVATVDHRLRRESCAEATAVAAWAEALGLPHTTLVWDGPKPTARVQERAREKRYELLLAHAKEIEATALATAHHADDQAETILFRLLRGSGLAGLSGMAAASARDGFLVSRPLLELPKQDLVATCEAVAHPYFRDPSNTDTAYARTRIRDLLARLEPDGLNRRLLLELGRRVLRAETALAEVARRASARLEADRGESRFIARAGMLASEPDEIIMRVLACEIKNLNAGHQIRLDRLESLAARLGVALRSGGRLCATLGGAIVELDPDGTLTLCREPPRRRGARVRSSLPRAGRRATAAKRSLGKDRDDA